MPMLFSEVQAEVQSWANTVNGKYIDFDGAYGAQCVDPALHYGATVHGYPRILGPVSYTHLTLPTKRIV